MGHQEPSRTITTRTTVSTEIKTRLRQILWTAAVLSIPFAGGAQAKLASSSNSTLQQTAPGERVVVPAGTRIVLAVVRPIASKSVNPGDLIYLQTTFPVIVGSKVAIPAGTFVQGVLAAPPNRLKHQIEIQMQPVVMIFGNGYTVTVAGAAGPAPAKDSAAQPGVVTASVDRDGGSSTLDIGSPVEIVLSAPLMLEEQRVADALHRPRRLLAVHDLMAASRPTQEPMHTCYTPEKPPKPAIVIPGTAAVNDQPATPDIYIPGIRAKPGTPYRCP